MGGSSVPNTYVSLIAHVTNQLTNVTRFPNMSRVRGAAQRQLTRSRGAPSLGCECEALGGDVGLTLAWVLPVVSASFSHSSHVPAPPLPPVSLTRRID
jgi:hypothetical protein